MSRLLGLIYLLNVDIRHVMSLMSFHLFMERNIALELDFVSLDQLHATDS